MQVHFIGIGGIGVSALAQYYLSQGWEVTGSDIQRSKITDFLEKKRAKFFLGHKKENILPGTRLVIFSQAIPLNNSELLEVRRLKKVQCQSYPQALGKLTKKFFTIAVAGTHGKGTTTAMSSLVLIRAGLDPTVIVGTKLKDFGDSNFRLGKGRYLVIEADEYRNAFLNYWPQIVILTNIEKEHLDYFKDFTHILESYQKFISRLPKNGLCILNKDDRGVNDLCKKSNFWRLRTILKFHSLSQKNEARILKDILKIPGQHNISNALAALTLARALNISDKISFAALASYRGAWRRFEEKRLVINHCSITIVSDYAHHPTEIQVTLKAARERFKRKRIILVFQPHQQQRTYYLFNDFVKLFTSLLNKKWIQELILDNIFEVSGREREKIKNKISSRDLKKAISKLAPSQKNKVFYLPGQKEIKKHLKENLKNDQVIVIMGAGDIYKLAEDMK